MLVVVGWVLAAAPVGVFARPLGRSTHGNSGRRGLLYYIVVLSVTLFWSRSCCTCR
jgi:hypothetical protein